MQRLFFGIYGAIFISILLVLSFAYFALSSINQYRYQAHLKELFEGSSLLIARGVARQEVENQTRWMSLASSLMNSTIQVNPLDQEVEPGLQIIPLNATSESGSDGRFQRYLAIYNSSAEQLQISVQFEGITEHVLSATAFFMLNEIGRVAPKERQQMFDEIKQHFAYDIYRANQADLDLDSRQQERLLRGETVVSVRRQFGQGLAFNVYAPWGKTEDALVMGPITFFDPFPPHIAGTVLGMALLLMALIVMLIIRKLGNRLIALQAEVDAISPVKIGVEQEEVDTEVVTALSNKIQKMAARIEKLLDDKAYMIRAVSHDLRTPISKIHFRLEALTESVGHDNKFIRGCHDDLRQLNLLIDELLTYEKLSEKQAIDFKPIDISEHIKRQMDGVGVIYPRLALNVNIVDDADATIEANDVLINRLLENLLHNAGRHAKSCINVLISQEPYQLVVTIDDDGVGIDESASAHLFEPFFKVDNSRTAGKGGYGLGLAIVKQVVMQHSGDVVASNNTMGGARFTLTFPIRQTQYE